MGFSSVNRLGYLFMIAAMFNSGCAPMFRVPMTPGDARLGEFSSMHRELLELPVPMEKIVVAVYQFRDQTGQYKLSEMGSNWSTAVTQGATSILIQSLEESGWFIPIERESLSNLLNERRIIRSSREQFGDNQGGNLLPPLLFGGITLEGGIISYETNVVTGGAGLRYFGTGISGEYREDKVSIYLRAVSTNNGRILKTVHSSKTILSQKLNTGIFRFVSLTRILEAETGYTYNEPSHMAVQEAIDKAVHAMIMEGIIDRLWLPADSEDINHPAIARYQDEKEMNYATDYLGFQLSRRTHGNFSIGLVMSAMKYDGDYEGGMVYPAFDLSVGVFQSRPFSMRLTTGISRLEVKEAFHANIIYGGVDFKYRFLNYYRGSPFLQAGGGLLNHTENMPPGMPFDFANNLMPYVLFSLGYEWLTTAGNGISVSLDSRQLLKDDIDGLVHGRYNDRILSVNVGVSFYLGGRKQRF